MSVKGRVAIVTGAGGGLGRYSPSFGIKMNAVVPSVSTLMTELFVGSKFVADTYLTRASAPVVVALVSDECPVSGEGFVAAANLSARMTMAAFHGPMASWPTGTQSGARWKTYICLQEH
ncbi:bifunctional hydroxyacyl-CoA dehydrogenase/enoyl-CoA hydratase fox2 [Sporothrix eucalyptigena]|uniref:Bifunctional hydroxyacyl-CoA dehydrogenase/enoyl-CoA hydratase fox2 n=1 Tax=Sporothrix eucalyptigena TaxID=1812306 RepID=A0ABP0C5Q0_9PEZI